MKKQFLTIFVLLALAIAAGAAETPQVGFWDSLKARVEKVTPRKKVRELPPLAGFVLPNSRMPTFTGKEKEVALGG